MDIHNTFLQRDLAEEVYVKPPLGFHSSNLRLCLLKKSLYGLRQAPRCWFSKLSMALTNYGFQRSYVDYFSLSIIFMIFSYMYWYTLMI